MSGGTVLIVDDNTEFRQLARRLLEYGGYEVVAEAEDAAGAIRAYAALRPDIVLLDVQLPDLDGFAIAEILAAEAPPPIVVLISSRDRGAYRRKLAATPARAFLPKGELSLQTFDQAVGA
jgi:DNA-binding NarL/FixJ family response regulator